MNIEINIEDYLSRDEIKYECKEAIKQVVYNTYCKESEFERLIANLSYEFIFKEISELTGKDVTSAIKQKIAKLLEKDDTIRYELFRGADSWGRKESPAIGILNQAIKESEPLIKQKVKEVFENYNFGNKSEIKALIEDTVYNYINNKLFIKDE